MAVTVERSFNIKTNNHEEFTRIKSKFESKSIKTESESKKVRDIANFLNSLTVGK